MIRLLPLLMLGGWFASAAGVSGPMGREYRRMERKGYTPYQKASAAVSGGTLLAVVYRKPPDGSWLNVYFVTRGKASLIKMKPGSSYDISLASIHEGGRLPDIIGDGSRIIAYRTSFSGVDQDYLVLLRYAKGRVVHVRRLPFGRFEDVDGDGIHEIVSRYRPLGQFFMVGCESFMRMAQGAFRTSIHAWRDGNLVLVSKRYPGYFADHIRELREDLSLIDLRSGDADPGEFLGFALSIYFDHDELGRSELGWQEFKKAFPLRRSDPKRVKKCMRQVEEQLREKLRIPDDW